ncbi:MAG: MarR family transcriptional regulator [Lachnospiraceae bacterium]|nr:MarR family transcriptional regulator [Lachnospiraceae bacterium]
MTDTETLNKDDVPRLKDQFCFPLYACAKEIVRQYRKPLSELNLTYTQYLVMMVLWEHGDMTEGMLGRKVHLDSGTLAPLLKRLERLGLINRIKPDGNVRKLYITLTQEGRNLKEKAKSVPGEIRDCIPLPEDDLLMLQELLNHLLISMEKNM